LSPILVRPVREQLEHDRVIRLLQAKYKRKYDVAINPGNEQTAPVGTGASAWYPDLVLQSSDRGRKLAGVVEVETAESVNNLEAMSQWATFARLRVPFHLYLPTSSVDSARRFCSDLSIPVAEMWAYQAVGDQLRFTLVQRAPQSADIRSVVGVELPAESKTKAMAKPAPQTRRAAGAARASSPAPRRASPARAAAPARATRRSPSSTAATRRTASSKAAGRASTPKSPVRGKTKPAVRRSSRAQKRR
jgi:hypothetical protein